MMLTWFVGFTLFGVQWGHDPESLWRFVLGFVCFAAFAVSTVSDLALDDDAKGHRERQYDEGSSAKLGSGSNTPTVGEAGDPPRPSRTPDRGSSAKRPATKPEPGRMVIYQLWNGNVFVVPAAGTGEPKLYHRAVVDDVFGEDFFDD